MKTPKEKAEELVDRFLKVRVDVSTFDSIKGRYLDIDEAKQCALICIDNEIELVKHIINERGFSTIQGDKIIKEKLEVRNEIERL